MHFIDQKDKKRTQDQLLLSLENLIKNKEELSLILVQWILEVLNLLKW